MYTRIFVNLWLQTDISFNAQFKDFMWTDNSSSNQFIRRRWTDLCSNSQFLLLCLELTSVVLSVQRENKKTDQKVWPNELPIPKNLANKYFFQPFNSFMALEETASGSEKGENECQIEKVENKFVHLNILLPLCI